MAKTAAKKPAAKRAGARTAKGKSKPAARARAATKKPSAARKPAARKSTAKAPARKTAAKKAPARKTAAKKAAPKRAASSKAAPKRTAAKRTAAKKSAPAKRAAKPKARSARLRATTIRATKREAKPARKPQRFAVSHYKEADFKRDGLRPYAMYRDLGFAAATSGLAQAHVIRLIPPCDPKEVAKLHYHDVDFQMVYVLKGWMKNEFEGQGVQFMRAGSSWIQPPGVKHKVLDYSDDCEVLEIILPAEFDTVTLD